jgi:hypothetical protein
METRWRVTTSWRHNAARKVAGSVVSTEATDTPASWSRPAAVPERAWAVTVWPAATSAGSVERPATPVPPSTKTLTT